MTVISILFGPLIRNIDTIADGDFYIQAVAVDKKHGGSGIGSALMDLIENHAKAGGSSRVVLDVSAKNKGAFRLYRKRGMVIDSRWPRRIAIPGLTIYRMAKALEVPAVDTGED
jgi:ribosomal protein S18 acetylase RimI-like enzyme